MVATIANKPYFSTSESEIDNLYIMYCTLRYPHTYLAITPQVIYIDLMSPNKTFKITFIGPESENIDLLMTEMREPTPQSLLRTLVKMRADNLRNKKLTYGPAVTRESKRENKEDSLNAMLALDNETLTSELERLHILDNFRSPGMSDMHVWIEDDGKGGRTVRYDDGSNSGERGFGEVITALRKIL